jgi:hypothetical protein
MASTTVMPVSSVPERAGLDTLVFIGDEVLRNPVKEVDSLLKEWNKTDIDSWAMFPSPPTRLMYFH